MRYTTVLVVTLACLATALACRPANKRVVEMEPLLSEGRADLLVVFRTGATQREINRYLEEKIVLGDLEKGFRTRPGIAGIMHFASGAYAGYSLRLDRNIPAEEKARLKRNLENSLLVIGVFEDVDPKTFVPDVNDQPRTRTDKSGTAN